jgi:hypothetical protein
MSINEIIKEKVKEEFLLLRKHYKDKTGNPFYQNHLPTLNETIFDEKGISIPQAKALVETIESLEAQERYPTLYNHCKEILDTSCKLEQLRTFKNF